MKLQRERDGRKGTPEAEALENIKDAIQEYLAVVDDPLRGQRIREVEVVVAFLALPEIRGIHYLDAVRATDADGKRRVHLKRRRLLPKTDYDLCRLTREAA